MSVILLHVERSVCKSYPKGCRSVLSYRVNRDALVLIPEGPDSLSRDVPYRDRTSCIGAGIPLFVSRSLAERGIRVLVQEVPQRRDKLPSMRNIVLPNGCANLIDQHVPDLFAPALALEQVIAKHSSCGWGNMLVRGHNLDLVRA